MSDKTAKIKSSDAVRFTRAATRHRVGKDSIRHVIVNHRIHFEEPPPLGLPGQRSMRVVYLGDDLDGRPLEVMAIELSTGEMLVIHAMPLRAKYRRQYEEVGK